MANVDVTLLLIAVFLIGFMAILILVGSFSVRTGVRALPNARDLGQESVWHKQPNILFGLNNFTFALLLGMVLLFLLITDESMKGIVAGIGMCLLILSIFLVIRSILYSLRAAKALKNKRTP